MNQREGANQVFRKSDLPSEVQELFLQESFGMFQGYSETRMPGLQFALDQLERDGLVRVLFRTGRIARQPIIMTTAAVPFDIVESRLHDEFALPVIIEVLPFHLAYQIKGDPKLVRKMVTPIRGLMPVADRDGNLIVLFASEEAMSCCESENRRLEFSRLPEVGDGKTFSFMQAAVRQRGALELERDGCVDMVFSIAVHPIPPMVVYILRVAGRRTIRIASSELESFNSGGRITCGRTGERRYRWRAGAIPEWHPPPQGCKAALAQTGLVRSVCAFR